MSIHHDMIEIHLNDTEVAGLIEISAEEEALLMASSLDELITDCELELDRYAQRELHRDQQRRKPKSSDWR